MEQHPREKLGDVFSATVDLHGSFYPNQIAELVARAAGPDFRQVRYHHHYDRYVLGRRTSLGLGGDFVITKPPTTVSRDYDMLWDLNARAFTYQKVEVFDCLWNDSLLRRPLSHLSFPKKNELIIQEGSKFVERLHEEAERLVHR